jgi:hypothetical protein
MAARHAYALKRRRAATGTTGCVDTLKLIRDTGHHRRRSAAALGTTGTMSMIDSAATGKFAQ